jgi:branched-chain amino acid transport system ATP-binding protein
MLNEPLSSARAVETLSGLLADGGMTVLLVEHDMEVVFGLANKITVLHPARSSPRIIISVPGRNGVGRTTTARAVMGLVPPASGRVLLDGVEIAGWAPRRMARRGRLCARGQAHLPDLTVVENIQVAERRPARAWPLAATRAHSFRAVSSRCWRSPARWFSDFKVTLLDEPSQGLAPLIVCEFAQVIRLSRSNGVTILLIEQNMKLAEEVANEIAIMGIRLGFERDRVVLEGPRALCILGISLQIL